MLRIVLAKKLEILKTVYPTKARKLKIILFIKVRI
jgi:hypothetical protein